MDIRVRRGDIARQAAGALVVNLFEGVTQPGGATGAVDRALDGAISRVIQDGDCRGKENEFTLIHTLGKIPSPRVLVAGLGKQEGFTLDKVRSVAAGAARYLRRIRCETIASITHGAGIADLDPEACAQAIAEGTILGLYTFDRHKKPKEDHVDVRELALVEFDQSRVGALRRGVERGVVLADAANFSRDLANEPGNVLTPTELAARAEALARDTGLECEVHDRQWMEEQGMGALLGVAKGSHQPPQFIVLRYHGKWPTEVRRLLKQLGKAKARGAHGEARRIAGILRSKHGHYVSRQPDEPAHLALVGKGITFDTGGISIKPAAGMQEMKGDMSGAAAVVAAMGAIARLKPSISVTAVVPATENMPGGSATKPGDILRTMSGKTIEVINTDAEGRLILADGLAYAGQQSPTAIVDVATLTGAIAIALGNVAVGAMTNNDALYARVQHAATTAGEKVWQLPMYDEYKEQIKSEVADMKNTGGRGAGSITAAFLLKEFVDDTPWVHLDMAGVDNYAKEKGVLVKGASGIPVRTLVHLALDLAKEPLGGGTT
jgi:leucyl aminopeptidase